MTGMFDYLKWRGDLSFTQDSAGMVDSLIFSTLSYIGFDGMVSNDLTESITLQEAARRFFMISNPESRIRVKSDLELLKEAAATHRFGNVRLFYYQNIFNPEMETQFAAITFLLDDGTAVLTFRGTDSSLIGWKEDFNMTFEDSVPAQRLAQEYVRVYAEKTDHALILCGHSKGGNLAVYAAAKNETVIQERIVDVYNHDGPGFREEMMLDTGYLQIVPKIRTYVPQSSVFGMLLEHEESYTVIKSRQIGLMQHDPYSWVVMGNSFVLVEELTAGSRFLDRTVRNWLEGMTREERNDFFDTIFDIIITEEASSPRDLVRPQNLHKYVKTLKVDEEKRKRILSVLSDLVLSVKQS